MALKPEFGYVFLMFNVLVYFYTKLEAFVRFSSLTITDFSPLPPKSNVQTNIFSIDIISPKIHPSPTMLFLMKHTAPTNSFFL